MQKPVALPVIINKIALYFHGDFVFLLVIGIQIARLVSGIGNNKGKAPRKATDRRWHPTYIFAIRGHAGHTGWR